MRPKLLMPFLDLDDVMRFWTKVVRGPDDECWIWEGHYTADNGCGRRSPMFKVRDTNYVASRISYWMHEKIDPGELEVCHSCDVPGCVNPKHLFLGTHQENAMDRIIKGRHPVICGRKLFPEDVVQIRLLRNAGISSEEIGRRYNITREFVWRIISGRAWSHV